MISSHLDGPLGSNGCGYKKLNLTNFGLSSQFRSWNVFMLYEIQPGPRDVPVQPPWQSVNVSCGHLKSGMKTETEEPFLFVSMVSGFRLGFSCFLCCYKIRDISQISLSIIITPSQPKFSNTHTHRHGVCLQVVLHSFSEPLCKVYLCTQARALGHVCACA